MDLRDVSAVFAALTLAGILVVPGWAFAEDDTGDLTDRQQQLNQEGVDAIDDGDYDTAVERLESSLELGELNITHVNLGRAHQLAGNCQKAEEHFEAANRAPVVDRPTPEQIAETVEDFRDELRGDCPGFLDVDCHPDEIALYLGGEDEARDCTDSPFELHPGSYDLRGEYDDRITETTVQVVGTETARVRLAVSEARAEIDEADDREVAQLQAPPDPEPAEPAGGSNAWMWFAAGGAALAGGIVLDTVPAQARNDEINAINFVPVGLYLTSATFSFFGIRSLMR